MSEKSNVIDLALARFRRRSAIQQPSVVEESAPKRGVTVDDVLKYFPGAKVVEIRGGCEHCSGNHIPAWRRRGKIIEAVLPDGRRRRQCHYCGRSVKGDQS